MSMWRNKTDAEIWELEITVTPAETGMKRGWSPALNELNSLTYVGTDYNDLNHAGELPAVLIL